MQAWRNLHFRPAFNRHIGRELPHATDRLRVSLEHEHVYVGNTGTAVSRSFHHYTWLKRLRRDSIRFAIWHDLKVPEYIKRKIEQPLVPYGLTRLEKWEVSMAANIPNKPPAVTRITVQSS
jgi:hypothetical protein